MADRGDVAYVRSGDGHIAYRAFGDGPLDVLLYPGAPLLPMESIDEDPSYARFADRLTSYCRLIQFDGRGIGLSDPLPAGSPLTLDDWVADSLAVLDALDCERAVLLAGRDITLEAIVCAARHPERVSKLVVINGVARMRRADDYPAGIPDRIADRFLATNILPASADDRADDFLTYAAPSVADDPRFRAWWERAGRQGASPSTARAFLRVCYDTDVRDLLPAISAPTLVLHRRDSRNLRVGHGRYLAEHIPGARYVELAGSDCLFWVGDTDQMLDEIEEFLGGSRRGAHADRKLAAVLLTDIVGSTARLAAMGDRRWRDTLDHHDALLDIALGRFGGRRVKATGDGALAVFDRPSQAVSCAVAIRTAVESMGLEIRTGVHFGELEMRGDDIAGMAVHVVARLESLAGPGEIAVSQSVADLLVDNDVVLADLGEHTLRGVPRPVRVFRVETER